MYIVVSCIISFLSWLVKQADWKVLRRIKSPYEFCFSANVNQFSGGQAPVPFLSLSVWQVACQNKCLVPKYKSSVYVCVCVC